VELKPEPGAAGLTFALLDAAGNPLPLKDGKTRTTTRGWHVLKVSSVAQGSTPFTLAVTWTSTQQL
jgi:hypothetical protein